MVNESIGKLLEDALRNLLVAPNELIDFKIISYLMSPLTYDAMYGEVDKYRIIIQCEDKHRHEIREHVITYCSMFGVPPKEYELYIRTYIKLGGNK